MNEGFAEGEEAAGGIADRRQIEEAGFGFFDLGFGGGVEIMGAGAGDHFLADIDEFAAQEAVEHGLAVVARGGEADDVGFQCCEIIGATDGFEAFVAGEVLFERYGRGELAAFDELADGFEDAAVDGIGEMGGAQELADFLAGAVVGQDGAEEGLFRFDVLRGRGFGQRCEGDGFHEKGTLAALNRR